MNQGLLSEGDSILKLGLSERTNEISDMLEFSTATQRNSGQPSHFYQLSSDDRRTVPIVDKGSTPAKKSGRYMPSLLLAPRMGNNSISLQAADMLEKDAKRCHFPELSSKPYVISDYSRNTISEPTTKATSSEHRTSNFKRCEFVGCTKGARGREKSPCIGHGGG